jgi:hypothetical protein
MDAYSDLTPNEGASDLLLSIGALSFVSLAETEVGKFIFKLNPKLGRIPFFSSYLSILAEIFSSSFLISSFFGS